MAVSPIAHAIPVAFVKPRYVDVNCLAANKATHQHMRGPINMAAKRIEEIAAKTHAAAIYVSGENEIILMLID